jgi:integrase
MDARYLEDRVNADGTTRRYWRRPGYDLVRLPNGPEWAAAITRLNQVADADGAPANIVIEGTIAWATAEYRESEEFEALADETKRIYRRWLKEFDGDWGVLPVATITRKIVVDFAKRLKDKPSTRKHAVSALRNTLEVGRYHGYIETNPTDRLKLKRPAPRRQVWNWDDIDEFSVKAKAFDDGEAATIFIALLLYTGQRPGDVITMRRNQFDGDTITVRQQKTRKLVGVPCHKELRPIIEQAVSGNSMYFVSQEDGRPYSLARMRTVCAEIRKEARLEHLQQRDLRRTAVVKLAEAGCTTPQIGAITGHKIDATEAILEDYMPRTLPMAQDAIANWEKHPRPGKKGNAE